MVNFDEGANKTYTDLDGQAKPKGLCGRCRHTCCHSWWQKTLWAIASLTAWSLLMVLPPLAPSEGQLMMFEAGQHQFAKCLDGSQAGYYIREGDPAKFVISLQGATDKDFTMKDGKKVYYAPCVDRDSCMQLKRTTMGSSNAWKKRIEFKNFPEANQWANTTRNGEFSSYTQVFIPYCSGDMWSGTKQYDGWGSKVYFHGHNIIDATVKELIASRYNISEANTVIFAGGGDGGVGVMLNLDYVANQLRQGPNVVGVPIAGWELSNNETYPNAAQENFISLDEASLEKYWTLWGSYVPSNCKSLNSEAPWRCMVADGSFETMSTQLFVVNAQTDVAGMTKFDGMQPLNTTHTKDPYSHSTPEQKTYITEWAQRLNSSLEKVVGHPRAGLFSPACYMHQGFGYSQPTINNMTYIQAFAQWLKSPNQKTKLRDVCGIACNPTCPESAV